MNTTVRCQSLQFIFWAVCIQMWTEYLYAIVHTRCSYCMYFYSISGLSDSIYATVFTMYICKFLLQDAARQLCLEVSPLTPSVRRQPFILVHRTGKKQWSVRIGKQEETSFRILLVTSGKYSRMVVTRCIQRYLHGSLCDLRRLLGLLQKYSCPECAFCFWWGYNRFKEHQQLFEANAHQNTP